MALAAAFLANAFSRFVLPVSTNGGLHDPRRRRGERCWGEAACGDSNGDCLGDSLGDCLGDSLGDSLGDILGEVFFEMDLEDLLCPLRR